MSALVSEEDARDIPLAMDGDEAAARRLYERYAPAVTQQMWRFSRDGAVHQELVQDVWVSALLNLATFRGQAPFLHWLRRIATHTGYRYWKRQARDAERRRDYEMEQRAAPTPEPESPTEAAEQLHHLLAQLPPDQRLVLTLFYFEACGVREIAERTGWSVSKVKICNMRARARLKTLLEEHGYARTQ